MTRVVLDARDAFLEMPHGSGIYVRRLLDALEHTRPAGIELRVVRAGGRLGPEVVFEQIGLPRLLGAAGADLLHGPDSFLPLARPCPGVLTVHDLAFEVLSGDMARRTELKYRALVRLGARSAQRVICPSEFTASDLSRRYGVARERIRVIPEAPALGHFDEPVPAGPYLLAAGDLRPKKNLGVLVQAFKRLVADGYTGRLVLAGADLGQSAALEALAPGVAVELTGFVSDARLDALIRGADAVVVPGFYEGFGLVAMDAMARARPVVLARAGALPEVGDTAALYFDPWDLGELVEVLSGLLASPQRQEEWSARAAARAGEFSWEATARATWAVYEELL